MENLSKKKMIEQRLFWTAAIIVHVCSANKNKKKNRGNFFATPGKGNETQSLLSNSFKSFCMNM